MLGRFQTSFELGLGKGFQVQTILPFDVKGSGIRYSLADGSDYTPTYAGIHHRNEVLAGLGDGQLIARQVRQIGDLTTFTIGVGLTLPFGTTEEDPFELAAESKEHQHFQFGTGTFMPSLQTSLLIRKDRFGGQFWAQGQMGLYDNTKGFRPGPTLTWGIAPQIKVHPRVDLLIPVQGIHQGRERWSGVEAESSGKHTLRVGVMTGITLKRGLWFYIQGSVPVWQRSLSSNTDDQILEPFVGTIGISWMPDKRLWGN